MPASLEEQLERLPDEPGVYTLRDASGKPLYIGKARSLRDRVRSHFRAGRSLDTRTMNMYNRVASVDYITTASEVEALILESNLVKEHKPEYNIKLRDDKHFPYLRIDLNRPYPRVEIVRRRRNDGARYFGPYTRAGSVRETLRTLRRVFPYRTCSDHRMKSARKPCLDYQIKRCAGPCAGAVTPEEYRSMMEEMCLFLEGRQSSLVSRLKSRMEEAAQSLEFEKAAELRDQLRAIEDVMERQSIILEKMEDQDVVGYAVNPATGAVAIQLFFVREGKVVGREGFIMENPAAQSGADIISAFLKRHYGHEAPFVPSRVLLPEKLPEEEARPIEEWLSTVKGRRVKLHRPARGPRRDLVELANRNAVALLQEEEFRRLARPEETYSRAVALGETLNLPTVPERIEGFDVSNIHGREAVGSMVVFLGGRPAPASYRRFKVRTKSEPDDYAMMQEVLYRRLRRLVGAEAGVEAGAEGGTESVTETGVETLAETGTEARTGTVTAAETGTEAEGETGEAGPAPPATEPDRFGPAPDLILIDGGKGHLAAALEVLDDLGLDLPILALAKEHEHVFLPGRRDPLILPGESPALRLLRHVRDEAHRFAVGYHRLLRRKSARRSELDDIPGVGPIRRTALLRAFGSASRVREAGLEDLAAVPEVGPAAARRIYDYFHGDSTGGSGEDFGGASRRDGEVAGRGGEARGRGEETRRGGEIQGRGDASGRDDRAAAPARAEDRQQEAETRDGQDL